MNSFGTIIESDTIFFERLLPGRIENAWDYVSSPPLLAQWLAEVTLEPIIGGRIELYFNISDADDRARAGSMVRGTVQRYEPPYSLAYTWSESLVAFELAPHFDEVLLTLRHGGLPPALRQTWTAGWHTHLDILQARMRNEKPESFLLAYRRLLRTYVDRAAALQMRP